MSSVALDRAWLGGSSAHPRHRARPSDESLRQFLASIRVTRESTIRTGRTRASVENPS